MPTSRGGASGGLCWRRTGAFWRTTGRGTGRTGRLCQERLVWHERGLERQMWPRRVKTREPGACIGGPCRQGGIAGAWAGGAADAGRIRSPTTHEEPPRLGTQNPLSESPHRSATSRRATVPSSCLRHPAGSLAGNFTFKLLASALRAAKRPSRRTRTCPSGPQVAGVAAGRPPPGGTPAVRAVPRHFPHAGRISGLAHFAECAVAGRRGDQPSGRDHW